MLWAFTKFCLANNKYPNIRIMKRSLPLSVYSVIFLLATLIPTFSFAQIKVTSTTGYSVSIDAQPTAIIKSSGGNCQYGYNYNVRLSYIVKINGTSAPTSLYTLQGTMGCGSSSHYFDLPNNSNQGSVLSSSNVWTSLTNCSIANVINMSCSQVTIEIEGPGISHRYVSGIINSILPVKLVDFTTQLNQGTVKINWSTATEENNDNFIIERSANGNDWSAIKTVKGAGNSTSLIKYESTDFSPLSGTSYYRLRQTNFDGQTTFSEVRTVENTNAKNKISLFPIPNSGNTVTLAGITNLNEQEISLMNAAGSVLYRSNLTKTSVELPNLNAGLYIIVLRNKMTGESESFRYVKI